MTEFNPERHYLGKLCRHGHEYKDTGKSLRRKSNRTCIKCENLKSERYRERNPEKAREIRRRQYHNNKEKSIAYTREWLQNNPEKRKLYRQRRSEKDRHTLRDNYVKKVIVKDGLYSSAKDIPQHIIDARRDLIKLNRKIRETASLIKEKEAEAANA